MAKPAEVVRLGREWHIGDRVGSGGFGQVFEAVSDGVSAVAKFVPKAPGADRELLFVNVGDAENVVPVIDSGETADSWVLVMPRADRSLRDHLESLGAMSIAEAVSILQQIAKALAAIDGRVVHRDLKPENVLYLNGQWCLADFGISRYAEATTAPDTKKFALSPPYAGPERFRGEHATSATDIYSFGVIAYELIAGSRPFQGPQYEQYREQHLNEDIPAITTAPARLASLITECLYKSAPNRPSAGNIVARLQKVAEASLSGGLARLQEAHIVEVQRRSEADRLESLAKTQQEKRAEAARDAKSALAAISDELREAITDAAPTVEAAGAPNGGWDLRLGAGRLLLTPFNTFSGSWGDWEPPIDVVAYASIDLAIRSTHRSYTGRSHSLWFCNAQDEMRYQWFETAFMESPLKQRTRSDAPFALAPGPDAGRALSRTMTSFQVAWPFTPLAPGDLDEFVDRWADWFGRGAQGQLHHPSQMPEYPPQNTWRQ